MFRVYVLRTIHGLFALYFISCLFYLFYSVFFFRLDFFLLISIVSLGIEGILVFVLNKGDCPLIYIQRKIGDEVPFFELFLSKETAKKAVPFFARLAWLALVLLGIRFVLLIIR